MLCPQRGSTFSQAPRLRKQAASYSACSGAAILSTLSFKELNPRRVSKGARWGIHFLTFG